MRELIITSLLAVGIFILGEILNADDATLNFLFNFIPVLIPTIVMWKNTPKNYLKFVALRRKDIKYTYTVKISNCDINPQKFKSMQQQMLSFNDKYKGNTKKVLTYSEDDLLYSTIIDVNTTILEINYYVENQKLLLSSCNSTTYRTFLTRIQLINDSLICALQDIEYQGILINLKVEYLTLDDEETRNPFVAKIFNGFKSKIISLRYKAQNGTEIIISNHCIEFLSSSLMCLIKDIKKEFQLF